MKALAALALVLCFNCASCADLEYVNYSVSDSYMNGKEQFSIRVKDGKLLGRDTIDDLQICQKDAQFICFYGPAINFSVPRAGVSIGQSWSNAGTEFSAIREESIEILGVKIPVFVIRSKNLGKESYFYYSEERGLIAIKSVDIASDIAHFYVATATCGFGAKADCSPH
jgi:hypothetical protein